MTGEGRPRPEPRQTGTFQIYLRMESLAASRFSGSLAGRLILCAGWTQAAAELAIATAIAGGALLAIDPDRGRLKAALRGGSCDFVVNASDEALRILKNELRKGTSVSVGLVGDAYVLVPELAGRGVQPDLIAESAGPEESGREAYRQALRQMEERGAETFADIAAPGNDGGSGRAGALVWTASTAGDLGRMDAIALEFLPAGDRTRRQWLERAGGYFRHQAKPERVFAAEPEERMRLIAAFQNARSSGAIASGSVGWQNSDGTRETVAF